MRICFIPVSFIILVSCNNSGKTVSVPDLPYLKADTLNQFKVGDRFILATSTNSCCMHCWEKDSTLQDEVPASSLVKYIETIEDPSDPDCAGCSNFYYRIYECVAPGSDTLRYAVIPMGDVGDAGSCAELERKQVDSSQFRNFIFSVNK